MKTVTGERKEVFKQSLKLSRGLYKYTYPELFEKNKSRLVIPYENLNFDVSKSMNYRLLNSYLKDLGYYVHDYIGGYAKKEGDKNTYKIGRLLKDNEYTLKKFKDCIYRQKLSILISKHPYDMLCASWNQDWHSCLEIRVKGEPNSLQIPYSATTNSCLIAYCLSGGDKKPLGRVFIVPYYDYETGDHWLRVVDTTYGIFPNEVKVFLQTWLNENYNHKITKSNSKVILDFCFPDNLMYNNNDTPEIKVFNEKSMDNITIRKLLNEGNLPKELKMIYKETKSKISKEKLDLIRSELELWYNYHTSYGKDLQDFDMSECRFLLNWVNDRDPIYNEVRRYINFVFRYNLKIKGSETIHKYFIDEYLDIPLMLKYIRSLSEPILWEEGKQVVNDHVEQGKLKKTSVKYKEIMENLL